MAGLLALGVVVGSGFRAPVPGIDWVAVGQALGKPLQPQMHGAMHAVLLVRNDPHVVAQGVPVRSEMGLAPELTFMPIGDGRAYVMGELTVTDTELNAVTRVLSDGGLGLTSMHKHLPAETPRIWWVHFASYAEPVAMAATIRQARHMTHKYPQLYYLHYWQTGDVTTLGRALRVALDKLAVRQSELTVAHGN